MIIIPSNVGAKGEPSTVVATISGLGTNPGGSHGLAIFPYNGYVYVGSEGEIAVIDPATNTVVNKFTSAGSFVAGKFFVHPVSGALYVGGTYTYGGAGSVYAVNGTSSVTLKLSAGGPRTCAFNADGSSLFVASDTSYYVALWNTSGSTWSTGTSFPGMAYNPQDLIRANNKFFCTGQPRDAGNVGYYGGLAIYDNSANHLASVYSATNPPYWQASGSGLCASNDGSKVYFSDSRNDALRTVNTTTNALVSTITFGYGVESGQGPRALAVSPSGADWNRIYALHTDGTLKVVDGSTQEIVKTVSGMSTNARGMCVSPVNKCIYVANYSDNTVSVIG